MVSLSHLAAGFLLTAGIGRPSSTPISSHGRLALYTVTVVRESCVWQQGSTLDVTPKTTEQNRIVCTGKSVAEVTNNKKLRSRYCTVEAIYRQTQSIARPLWDCRASCYDAERDLSAIAKFIIQLLGKKVDLGGDLTVLCTGNVPFFAARPLSLTLSQRENRNIYIMQEYFYTKFFTFIHHICLHKSV